MVWNMRIFTIVTASSLLMACDPIDVCSACIESNPADPVAAADYSKIRFNYGKIPLPDGAEQVYYHEECGIDCVMFSKFRLPIKEAVDFAQSIRKPEKAGSLDRLPAPPSDIELGWWPENLPATATGSKRNSSVEGDPYVNVAVVKKGQFADVFVYSWTM